MAGFVGFPGEWRWSSAWKKTGGKTADATAETLLAKYDEAGKRIARYRRPERPPQAEGPPHKGPDLGYFWAIFWISRTNKSSSSSFV